MIAVPALYPINVLPVAFVPLKESPAFAPPTVLFCASVLNPAAPPDIPVRDEPSPTNFCAVTIPVYVA